jgi:hypothetical protein
MKNKGVRYPSRRDPPEDADDPSGQYVRPGTYTLIGLFNEFKDSTTVTVRLDPRLDITMADLEARNTMINELSMEVDRAQIAFKALQDVRKDMKMMQTLIVNSPDSTQKMMNDTIKGLTKKLDLIEKGFMKPESSKGYTYEVNLDTYLGDTGAYLYSSLGDPGSNARNMLKQTKVEVAKNVEAVNAFLDNEWNTFKAMVEALEWPLFKEIKTPK